MNHKNRPVDLSADGGSPKRKKRRGRAVGWIIVLVVLISLCLAGWYAATHVIYAGRSIPKGTAQVDFRDQALTPEEYNTLQARLPETEILWNVPLSTGAVDCRSEVLSLSELSPTDQELFSYLPRLRAVEFTEAFTDYPAALSLRQERPDIAVSWSVEIAGKRYPDNTVMLSLPVNDTDMAELNEKLSWLPLMKAITFTDGPLSYEQMDALTEAWPDIVITADLTLCGVELPITATVLSLVGRTDLTEEDLRAIRENQFRFPALATIDCSDCGLSDEALVSLAADTGLDVVWYTEVYGVPICSLDEEIDLSNNKKIKDGGAAVEALLPGMHHLQKVIMSNCGISNEDMDALDQRHEDVRFVWTVYFSIFSMRTDENNFIAARHRNHAELGSIACRVLKYCRDLIALDLGHKDIQELSFLYDLPKLQYLILAECTFGDITPIGSLKELKYLEIFWTKVEHLEPLLNCTKLQDLNICYIYARHYDAYPVLVQMTWLERLWYCGNALTEEEIAGLKEALPNCEMDLRPHAESTGGGWREHPHYYEMRDVFGMYYMPGGTNGVGSDGHQIVISG
ncbi:MAG: hypothetical protein IKO22_02090 [Oscillospiraceae bacterium]|nr:hypothetical protein [Oscillospiraceae bacterium]